MDLRTGTDIVQVARVARLIERRGFVERWFTPDEISYCSSRSQPALHYAARLAAKEAVLKCLRWSWDGPIPWREIEVRHDASGAPQIRLSGSLTAAERAPRPDLQVSLSHCQEYAIAVAVALWD